MPSVFVHWGMIEKLHERVYMALSTWNIFTVYDGLLRESVLALYLHCWHERTCGRLLGLYHLQGLLKVPCPAACHASWQQAVYSM